MRGVTTSLILLMFPTLGMAQNSQIPGSAFGFGNWNGSAFYNTESGTFSHCAVSAGFVSGDTLLFSITEGVTVNVGVASPAITFPEGHQIPVAIYVDRRQPFYGTAFVRGENFAALEIEDFDRALESFKRGYGMVIEGGGLRGVYDLSGTFRALESARNCAIKYFNYSDPVTGARDQGLDPAIGYQLAASMIANLGLRDTRFLTANELEAIELSGAVYWVSESTGVSGGIMSFNRPSNYDLKQADFVSTEYLSRGCDGDIASSIRAVPGEIPMRQIRVICAGSEHDYEVFLTNSGLDGMQLVTILRFDDSSSFESDTPRLELNEQLALQNASLIIQAK